MSMEKLCKAVQYVMTRDICSVFLDLSMLSQVGQVMQHLLHLFTSISQCLIFMRLFAIMIFFYDIMSSICCLMSSYDIANNVTHYVRCL